MDYDDSVKYNQPQTDIDPEFIYRGRREIITSWPPRLAKDICHIMTFFITH